MSDPRKPVLTPDTGRQADIRAIVHKVLLSAAAVGAREIGTTGAAFVTIGMGVWAAELAELDGSAAARYLRAMADIFDPKSNDAQKRRAEARRVQAVRQIYAALDLEMAEAKGHG